MTSAKQQAARDVFAEHVTRAHLVRLVDRMRAGSSTARRAPMSLFLDDERDPSDDELDAALVKARVLISEGIPSWALVLAKVQPAPKRTRKR